MPLLKLTSADVQFTETIKYIQGNLNDITQITPMLIDEVCAAIESGASYETAAMSVGVSPATLVKWLQRGNSIIDKERTPLTEVFAKKIAQATAQREIRSLQRLEKAAEGGNVIEETIITQPNGAQRITKKYAAPSVQADTWYLERKHPERWGKTEHKTVDVTHTIKQYTDDQLDERIKALMGEAQGINVDFTEVQ